MRGQDISRQTTRQTHTRRHVQTLAGRTRHNAWAGQTFRQTDELTDTDKQTQTCCQARDGVVRGKDRGRQRGAAVRLWEGETARARSRSPLPRRGSCAEMLRGLRIEQLSVHVFHELRALAGRTRHNAWAGQTFRQTDELTDTD